MGAECGLNAWGLLLFNRHNVIAPPWLRKRDYIMSIVMSGSADLVFFAREILRNPYFALQAEKALNQTVDWPQQYGYAVTRMRK